MELIWESDLDKKYLCQVHRNNLGGGILTIKYGETLLLEKDVVLSFGAFFGPDVGDVYEWQDMCVEFIDNLEKKDA